MAGFLPNNTFSRAELSENGRIQNIHYGDVLIKFGEVLDVANEQLPFVAKTKKINKISELKLENGDIVFADAAEDKTVGKCTELFNIIDKIVISGLHTIPCRPQIAFATAYLGYFFNSPCYRTQLLPLMQGIKVLSLSKTALLQTDIFYPKDQSEQARIGTFFRHLDRLITLHQCNCNMATRPCEWSSGLRAIAWEQRKVGNLIEDYVERTTIQNQYPVLTSSQQQGIVLQEAYFADRQVTTNDNVGYFVLPKGYFTYRSRSDTDVFVFNRNDILDKGIISYYYPVFQTKYTCSDFLLRRLNHGIRKQLAMAAEGTGQKVLAHSKFKNMTVSVPKIGEQQKIGTFFRQLDRLITLHQRKHILLT